MQMQRILLVLLLTSITLCLNAQLNVKVAYQLAYTNASENNSILSSFNELKAAELNAGLSKEFSPLRLMNGIVLGLRHRISDAHSIELGYEHSSSSKEAVGENMNGSLFQQSLFYSSSQYYLDYQTHISRFGFGLGIGRSRFKIKDEIGNSDVKKELVNENQWVARTNLSFFFSGAKNLSFCLQPFLNLSLDDVPISALSDELGTNHDTSVKDNFTQFGIRFVFYNGAQ